MWLQIWWEEGATLHLSITNMARTNITYAYSTTLHFLILSQSGVVGTLTAHHFATLTVLRCVCERQKCLLLIAYRCVVLLTQMFFNCLPFLCVKKSHSLLKKDFSYRKTSLTLPHIVKKHYDFHKH